MQRLVRSHILRPVLTYNASCRAPIVDTSLT